MKTEKTSVGKKVGSIIGIVLASLLVILTFCGRFCNTEASQGFMHFANFFVGSFGMFFYGIMAAIIVTCSFVLAGKSVKIPFKYVIHFILMFIAIVLLVHILTTTYLSKENFATHMYLIYHYYDGQMGVPTFGGVVFGVIAYGLQRGLTVYGASILLCALLGWTAYVVGDFFYKFYTGKLALASKPVKEDIEPTYATKEIDDDLAELADDPRKKAYDILFANQESSIRPEIVTEETKERFDVAEQSKMTDGKDDAAQILFGGYTYNEKKKGNTFFGEDKKPKSDEDEYLVRGYYQGGADKTEKKEDKAEDESADWKISYVPKTTKEQAVQPKEDKADYVVKEEKKEDVYRPPIDEFEDDEKETVDFTEIVTDVKDVDVEEYDDEEIVDEKDEQPVEQVIVSKPVKDKKEIVAVMREDEVDGGMQVGLDFISQEELEESQKKIHQYLEYNVPPLDLLNDKTIIVDNETEDRKRSAQAIVNKLAVFGIKIELADIIVGPSVTRYMFNVLSQKTRMGDFRTYSDDIKACVEAQDDIRIEAPVHGTNMVGIEVANKTKRPVVLRTLLESTEFQEADGKLVFAIGQEITGKVVVADLSDMPHLLIAGTTGSGKSVCLNCLIVSLMYKYGPEYVRFVMVDPKFVELSRYNGIPHMLTTETITTMQDALACMDYLIAEMELRYQLFRQNGVDKISEYNKRINPKIAQKLPYLVFVVDELADLMATNKKSFEAKLMRLAQKARAAGIHIVLATQRPDTNVITGTIKSNLPCRMALKVASVYDSQTIIGGGGAEKLLGRGDMLFMNSSGSSELTRVQGAYISNDEIRALVSYSISVNEVFYDTSISDTIFVSRAQEEEKRREEEAEKDSDGGKENQLDPLCKKALRYWLEKNGGKASISSIQRALGMGFNRAGRIMDSLQKLGYVEELSSSETSGNKVKVLVSLDELDSLFPNMED